MRLTKYLSTNILFLLGIWLFWLFILLVITDFNYDGTNMFYGFSLFEDRFVYLTIIVCSIIFTPIEMLFHKITHNKFILNIPFGNEGIKYVYNILFWLGIISSIFYLSVYIWGITRLTS